MTDIDHVRRAALDRIEQGERTFKAMIFVAALVEAGFLGSFLLLADLRDRLHLLLLLASFGVYTIVVCGLFALGAHVSRCTGRVLQAIDLMGREKERS
jgi:hypothetical protein